MIIWLGTRLGWDTAPKSLVATCMDCSGLLLPSSHCSFSL